MASDIEGQKQELQNLITKGNHLYLSMLKDVHGDLPDNVKEALKKHKIKLPRFNDEYDTWYSEALAVIKQLLPDRADDFIKQYKDEKRKELNVSTYGVYDYLLGLRRTSGLYEEVIVDKSAAIGKMEVQNSILKAVEKRFESSLFDIQEVLQADVFDSELESAKELAKKGFVRGGGAVAGVVLEKHLGHVCATHNLKSRKKHPTISDYYQMLKENDVIDTAKWRFIQHLGDLRNLCDHNKDREPTKEDILELVEGVEKVIKTVY
jgi:hypothetical protein